MSCLIRATAFAAVATLAGWHSPASLTAQEDRPRPRFGPPGPVVVSPEIAADRRLTFRVRAPRAEAVRLASSDLPGIGWGGAEMQKGEEGVWELTVGPIDPGAYRYSFNIGEVSVLDPVNPTVSESNSNAWSLVYVPGAEFSDTRDVPHGAVAEVTYYSKSLERFRRMHVYTPPGYEAGGEAYPVLYLLHGALDSDDSWTTVGRAGFILDNLIADGQARLMLVVMPAGHTGPFRFGPPAENSFNRQVDEFARDFTEDVRPLIERLYRVKTDRAHRAIAGLSMGGMQTLNIAAGSLQDYAYVGVFSSGVFGIGGGPFAPPGPSWEERYQAALDNAELKQGLKLVWFATGKDDFLLETSRGTVELLKRHGFDVAYEETDGGHTWTNWRVYLRDFAPRLFQ